MRVGCLFGVAVCHAPLPFPFLSLSSLLCLFVAFSFCFPGSGFGSLSQSMKRSLHLGILATLLSLTIHASASVTTYGLADPRPTPCIGAAACDGGSVTLDANPDGLNLDIPIQISTTGSELSQLARNVHGSFLGFSIELSVANKICESPSPTRYFPYLTSHR